MGGIVFEPVSIFCGSISRFVICYLFFFSFFVDVVVGKGGMGRRIHAYCAGWLHCVSSSSVTPFTIVRASTVLYCTMHATIHHKSVDEIKRGKSTIIDNSKDKTKQSKTRRDQTMQMLRPDCTLYAVPCTVYSNLPLPNHSHRLYLYCLSSKVLECGCSHRWCLVTGEWSTRVIEGQSE